MAFVSTGRDRGPMVMVVQDVVATAVVVRRGGARPVYPLGHGDGEGGRYKEDGRILVVLSLSNGLHSLSSLSPHMRPAKNEGNIREIIVIFCCIIICISIFYIIT